jgi:hypothetical protein
LSRSKIAQRKNPKTGNWVKIDTRTNTIISQRKEKYKNVPILRRGRR